MDVKISPRTLSGELSAIASKSYAHRILTATFLSGNPIEKIALGDPSEDIEATALCLKQLDKEFPVLDCRESGSTLRFLLPLAAVLGKRRAVFKGSGNLPARPLSPLKEQLEEHGCIFSTTANDICTIEGKLKGGTFTLSGDVSSQFVTGLLFALPLLEENSELLLSSPLQSADYVTMTLQTLALFGIKIETLFDEDSPVEAYAAFRIKGKQRYVFPASLTLEGDWSNAAFWLAAAAVSPLRGIFVTCKGLNLVSSQGDRKITAVIKAFGGHISKSDGSVTAFADELHGIEVDAADIPDLVPIISVMASVSPGMTEIIHAERLRIKESDRLHALYDGLKTLGADIEELPDGLRIRGVDKLRGGTVFGYNDHRIVMALAIASIRSAKPVIIKGAEAVNKSYPRFFDDFKKLGGDVIVI